MSLAEERGVLNARQLLHPAHTPVTHHSTWPALRWLESASELSQAMTGLLDRKAKTALSLQDSRRHQLSRKLQSVLESARFLPNAKVQLRLQEIRVDLVDPNDTRRSAATIGTARDGAFFQVGVDRVSAQIDSHESGKLIVTADVGEIRGRDRRPEAAFPVPIGLLQGHQRVKEAEQEATQQMQSLQRREDEEIRREVTFSGASLAVRDNKPASTGKEHLAGAVRRVSMLRNLVGSQSSLPRESSGASFGMEESPGAEVPQLQPVDSGLSSGGSRRGRAASHVLLGGGFTPTVSVEASSAPESFPALGRQASHTLEQAKWWGHVAGTGSSGRMNAEAVVGRLGEIHRSILRWDARLTIERKRSR